MANNSNLSKRAALRQQQELEERRKRNSKMIGIGLGVLAVILVAVLAIVLSQVASRSQATQQTPPSATEGYGISLTSKGTQPADGVPHVVLYEDYQCSGCYGHEQRFGKAYQQLIDEGKITMEIRTAYFMDGRFDTQRATNRKSSERAALAAAAADAVGKYREYHDVVFANYPTQGEGYSDEQLRVTFAEQAGITGEDLTKFQELYDTKAFQTFAENAYKAMEANGITHTPTVVVNGTELDIVDDNDQYTVAANDAAGLLAAIEAIAK